jgi:hypothetical protein
MGDKSSDVTIKLLMVRLGGGPWHTQSYTMLADSCVNLDFSVSESGQPRCCCVFTHIVHAHTLYMQHMMLPAAHACLCLACCYRR